MLKRVVLPVVLVSENLQFSISPPANIVAMSFTSAASTHSIRFIGSVGLPALWISSVNSYCPERMLLSCAAVKLGKMKATTDRTVETRIAGFSSSTSDGVR
jgi:hypothetical protein